MGKLSWEPRSRGSIYCSSACGGDCTRGAYEFATKSAKALAKRLGKGWKPHVWENLGWHWIVIKGKALSNSGIGFFEISQHGNSYFAWIQSSPQFIVEGEDPIKAFNKAIKQFDKYLEKLLEQRRLISELVKEK